MRQESVLVNFIGCKVCYAVDCEIVKSVRKPFNNPEILRQLVSLS